MLSLLQQLQGTGEIIVKKTSKRGRTASTGEKKKKTDRAKRVARWTPVFAQFGYQATSKQLANHRGMSVYAINPMLRNMENETPPLVERVGTVPNGKCRPLILWRWLGETK